MKTKFITRLFFSFAIIDYTYSCGNNDDNNTNPEEAKVENNQQQIINSTPEKFKPFIGWWAIVPNDIYHYVTFPQYSIIFYQDGICEIPTTNSTPWGNNTDDKKKYSWDYDEEKKILAIAGVSAAQWQITALGDGSWSGLALWNTGSNAYSANRSNDIISYFDYLLRKTWINGDISTSYMISEYGYNNIFYVHKEYETIVRRHGEYVHIPHDKMDLQIIRNNPIETCIYDNEKDAIIVRYEGEISKEYTNENDKTYRQIEIVHPFSYNDMYLNFTFRQYEVFYTGTFYRKDK